MNIFSKHPVVSGVTTGVILLLLQWATGYVSTAITWVFSILLIQISLSVWALILSVLVAVCSPFIFNRLFNAKAASQDKITKNQLTDRQIITLRMHAEAKQGQGVVAESLVKHLSIHKEEAQYLLDSLNDKFFIQFAFYADNGEEAYQLTRDGRKYLVENGHV